MFKNIQKSLLIKHPLLWNTKIVPLFSIMFIVHIIFFVVGFFDGGIDFSEIENPFGFSFDKQVVIFFAILASILSMIIWLVFYFKNNSFKSLYPKSRFSLYKEWLIQLFASLLICGFTTSYFYGKDVRGRSYFSEEEAIRRTDIIRSASLFTRSSFENDEYIMMDSANIKKSVHQDFVVFNGKKYSLNSLMNKDIQTFQFFSPENDSLKKVKLKMFLAQNQKDSVREVLRKFMSLSKEHLLKANIDEEKWLELVYFYPDFEQTNIIGNSEQEYGNDFNYGISEAEQSKDSLNQYWKIIDNTEVTFNKHYVPMKQMQFAYEKVTNSYRSPNIDSDSLLVLLYFAFGCSVLIFSFRVTSGRNWLISLVGIGILNMVFGLFTVVFGFGVTYQSLIQLLYIIIVTYFLVVIRRNTEKGASGIVLNGILWLTPAFIPILYGVILDIMKVSSGYYETLNYDQQQKTFPTINFLERNFDSMMYLNVIFIFLAMLFLSVKIKRWKGIAEG